MIDDVSFVYCMNFFKFIYSDCDLKGIKIVKLGFII